MASLVSAGLRVSRLIRPDQRRTASMRGPTLPRGRDRDGLTPWQVWQAEWWLAALHGDQYRAVCQALDDAEPWHRPHLRRALASGRSAREVLDLAALLRTQSPEWAATRLRLIDDDVPGPQRRLGARIDQAEPSGCGAAVLLVLATEADPLLSLELTAPLGDERGEYFEERFDRRQRAVKREANRLWPGVLGITPWGMARWLRRHAPGVGPYRVRLVDDRRAEERARLADEVTEALDVGDRVPLLVGAGVPRHYVLALRRDGENWWVYEPTNGEVRIVPIASVCEARLRDTVGFAYPQGALLPEW